MSTQHTERAPITVHLLYFASVAEATGRHEDVVHIAPDSSLTELYAQIQARYGITRPYRELRVAVNDDFAPWTTVLQDGDWVAFIPPVAGG
ncbi:MoaD/ThiS family protein [Psychrobacter aestuarii]|uniref:Molybdopterin synthase sulfur carrier subunit n=1 Tax=Psychrobacter aestuarii TaxID=556327 RepID=A0ABP3FIM8_9GAMM|nr:MoaD/ThiS family protein [Psychrobacter aestuarii]